MLRLLLDVWLLRRWVDFFTVDGPELGQICGAFASKSLNLNLYCRDPASCRQFYGYCALFIRSLTFLLPCLSFYLQGKGSRIVATMAKKSVGDLSKADLDGKVVFVRADLNVSLKTFDFGWRGFPSSSLYHNLRICFDFNVQ